MAAFYLKYWAGTVVKVFQYARVWLPAMLMLLKPGTPRREVGFSAAAPLDRWLHTHRKTVLWAFAASMAGSIALLPFVQFDFNPLHLRAKDGPAMPCGGGEKSSPNIRTTTKHSGASRI